MEQNTNPQLIELAKINEINVNNLFFDNDTKQFFTKYKKKVVIEVDDYKPVLPKTINSNYMKKNGERVAYSHQYVHLLGKEDKAVSMRLTADEIKNAQLTPGPNGKFTRSTDKDKDKGLLPLINDAQPSKS
jgi:hypothetical protein